LARNILVTVCLTTVLVIAYTAFTILSSRTDQNGHLLKYLIDISFPGLSLGFLVAYLVVLPATWLKRRLQKRP
jgi:hypothetical protein